MDKEYHYKVCHEKETVTIKKYDEIFKVLAYLINGDINDN